MVGESGWVIGVNVRHGLNVNVQNHLMVALSFISQEGDSAFIKGGMRVGAICPGYVETVLGKAGNMLLPDDNWPSPVP